MLCFVRPFARVVAGAAWVRHTEEQHGRLVGQQARVRRALPILGRHALRELQADRRRPCLTMPDQPRPCTHTVPTPCTCTCHAHTLDTPRARHAHTLQADRRRRERPRHRALDRDRGLRAKCHGRQCCGCRQGAQRAAGGRVRRAARAAHAERALWSRRVSPRRAASMQRAPVCPGPLLTVLTRGRLSCPALGPPSELHSR